MNEIRKTCRDIPDGKTTPGKGMALRRPTGRTDRRRVPPGQKNGPEGAANTTGPCNQFTQLN